MKRTTETVLRELEFVEKDREHLNLIETEAKATIARILEKHGLEEKAGDPHLMLAQTKVSLVPARRGKLDLQEQALRAELQETLNLEVRETRDRARAIVEAARADLVAALTPFYPQSTPERVRKQADLLAPDLLRTYDKAAHFSIAEGPLSTVAQRAKHFLSEAARARRAFGWKD